LNIVKPQMTLEIGSYNVNGMVERQGDYTGIDMRSGPNVDLVMNGHDLQFKDASFDCVICAETLEHDDMPWQTAKEIHRVLKDEGVLIVTVPGIGFPRHDFPSDYWRFTAAGVKALFKDFVTIECVEDSTEKAVRAVLRK